MLEKDPVKRINASSALSHLYFSSNMDLEMPKEINLNVREYFSPKNKMAPDTPTTMNGKTIGRILLQSSHSHELRPAAFLS
jgi:serine/threonine protein kinase